MLVRIAFLLLVSILVARADLAVAGAAPAPAALPPLPHTVGMSGRDVTLIDSAIAAFERGDLRAAHADLRAALAIRPQTAIANFDLGVIEVRLGNRRAGERAMRRGYRLANEHGMGASPQAQSMREIARILGIVLG